VHTRVSGILQAILVLAAVSVLVVPSHSQRSSASRAAHSALRFKILDPASAAISSARVALYAGDSSTPVAVAITGADGIAEFRGSVASAANQIAADRSADRVSDYHITVLAPGFSEKSVSGKDFTADAVDPAEPIRVQLTLAVPATTVLVTAERTPLPLGASGAITEWLDGAQLETLRPVSAINAIRFLPGAVVSVAGRRGGQSSLFVRGGDSRYNKVIVDGVTVNDPGGTFDFGVVPVEQMERMEFVRGPQSTLYGSDAMTSVVETWSANGTTRMPELRFGASGGSFGTADGFASLAGARGRVDYNLFGDEFHTQGQGVNDAYFNSLQGANIGVALSPRATFRFRTRHSNSRTGVQSFWNFNGNPLLPPDTDQRAAQNNFLASGELTLVSPNRWSHRITVFEYNHQRSNVDSFTDAGRISPAFGNFDFPFSDQASINRAGVEYQGEYWARSWARSTFGYRFEDENGFVGDTSSPPISHGLRRNHAVYGQEVLTWGRATVIGGVRLEHNESFGNKAVPRVSLSLLALRGGELFSGTRLRFTYGTGIKEPRLEESFGQGGFGIVPNPNLRPEQNRSFETGIQQNLFAGKAWFAATYFHNLFRDQIAFSFNPVNFVSQYVNLNKALAHGAEFEIRANPWRSVSISAGYTYTSTQILESPLAFDPLLAKGAPLLRRPRHSGTILATYTGRKWGGSAAAVFVGRRPDSDFLGLLPPVTYAAGYGRLDLGLWRRLNRYATAFVNLENVTNRHYEEAAGYPALRANFRAGMRFRLGGE
jgi:outer membrane cobalamin receptor